MSDGEKKAMKNRVKGDVAVRKGQKNESPTDESVGFILGACGPNAPLRLSETTFHRDKAGICFLFSSSTKQRRSSKRIPADGTDSGTNVPVQGRKAVWILVITTVLIIFFGLIGYHYIIPRVQLDAKVIYHEEVAGNIHVNVKLTNSGNKMIENLEVTINFANDEGKEMGNQSELFPSMDTGAKNSIHINSTGDPNIGHRINLILSFSAGGNEYTGNWTLEDNEGYMNVAFERTVKDWFP